MLNQAASALDFFSIKLYNMPCMKNALVYKAFAAMCLAAGLFAAPMAALAWSPSYFFGQPFYFTQPLYFGSYFGNWYTPPQPQPYPNCLDTAQGCAVDPGGPPTPPQPQPYPNCLDTVQGCAVDPGGPM